MKYLLTFLLLLAFFSAFSQSNTLDCCIDVEDIIKRSQELKTECCVFKDEVVQTQELKAEYCYTLNVLDANGYLIESIQITRSEPLFLGRAQILECNENN